MEQVQSPIPVSQRQDPPTYKQYACDTSAQYCSSLHLANIQHIDFGVCPIEMDNILQDSRRFYHILVCIATWHVADNVLIVMSAATALQSCDLCLVSPMLKTADQPILYGTRQLHIYVEGGTLHNDVGRIHTDALKLIHWQLIINRMACQWQAIRFMISSPPDADTIIIPLPRRPVLSTPSSTTYQTEGPADDSANRRSKDSIGAHPQGGRKRSPLEVPNQSNQ